MGEILPFRSLLYNFKNYELVKEKFMLSGRYLLQRNKSEESYRKFLDEEEKVLDINHPDDIEEFKEIFGYSPTHDIIFETKFSDYLSQVVSDALDEADEKLLESKLVSGNITNWVWKRQVHFEHYDEIVSSIKHFQWYIRNEDLQNILTNFREKHKEKGNKSEVTSSQPNYASVGIVIKREVSQELITELNKSMQKQGWTM